MLQKFGFDIKEQVRGGLSDANILGDWIPTIDGLGPNGMYKLVRYTAVQNLFTARSYICRRGTT